VAGRQAIDGPEIGAARPLPAGGAKFPVFPVKPGILSIFFAQLQFGREDSEANQALANEFP
jgi:hypothetical protein